MKRLGVFILLPGWDASPLQGFPQHYAGTHLYTWVERGTVRVKCLAQEHNTMSPARPRSRTTRSGVERTNHEATAPPVFHPLLKLKGYIAYEVGWEGSKLVNVYINYRINGFDIEKPLNQTECKFHQLEHHQILQ